MSGKNQKWLQEHQDHYKRMAEKSMKNSIDPGFYKPIGKVTAVPMPLAPVNKNDKSKPIPMPIVGNVKKMPWTVEDRKNNKLKKMPFDPNNKPKWKFLYKK